MIAGAYDVVVAGGVEVMTRVPMGVDGRRQVRVPVRAAPRRAADQGGIVPQGISAELIADKWGITARRWTPTACAPSSAREACREGRFEREIVAVLGADGRAMEHDEGLRETTLDSLARLKPAFRSEEDGASPPATRRRSATGRLRCW